jgi:hypothetical protein
MRGERAEIAPTDAVLKGARVESVAWMNDGGEDWDAEYLVITFSTGATLYADAPALYVDRPTPDGNWIEYPSEEAS